MASEGFRIGFRRFFAIMSSFHMKPLRAEVAVLRSEIYFRIFYYPHIDRIATGVCDRTRHTRRCMDTKIVLDMLRCQRWAPSCRAPNTGTLCANLRLMLKIGATDGWHLWNPVDMDLWIDWISVADESFAMFDRLSVTKWWRTGHCQWLVKTLDCLFDSPIFQL